ncbi:MAG TPA: hypothetical protein VGO46_04970 [Gemmatimonadaceae bacterium]|nr:hypothetical protein [Gemmatimonadaceae bacterium]
MLLSTFNRHSLRTALMTTLVIAAGACSDQSITSSATPVAPPAATPNYAAGMLRGTVREDGTVVLESLDPSIQVGDGNTSGAIYGNQNVTAKVTASNFSLTTSGGTKKWTFTLAVHNLLNYPVGSIDGGATPYDTVGVYVFFPTAPSVVSPANSGAKVTVLNTQGSASFSGINQQYYWYHDRLAAKGQTGDSTKNNPTWTFTAPSTVNSFRFTVLLSAPWPRGMQAQDTSWAVAYNPTADSLPDVNASPRWKRIGLYYGGTYSTSSAGLNMNVDHSSRGTDDDMFFFRSDNLNRTEKAYVQANVKLTSVGGNNPVFILALADSIKFVGLGIGNGKIGMATFNPNNFQWEWLSNATTSVTTTAAHTYRVGKFGADSSVVYVDGVRSFATANTLFPNNFMPTYSAYVGAQAARLSVFFGPTAQDADANAIVTSVNYAFHATPKP